MVLKGKLAELAHKSEESKLKGSGLNIAEKAFEKASKLIINFKTRENEENRLLEKWAYMNVNEDGKNIDVIDKDGENLGHVTVKGDNYFLEIGDMTVMAHKEEKGWTLYDVTNNGFHLAPIDKNSTRVNKLKPLFHEARMAINYPGGRRVRIYPMAITPKTR